MNGSWKCVKRAAEDSRRKGVHCLMVGQRNEPSQQKPTGYKMLDRVSKMAGLKVRWKGVEWIHLAQNRNNLLPLVNTVIILTVSQSAETFLNSCQEGLYCMELVMFYITTLTVARTTLRKAKVQDGQEIYRKDRVGKRVWSFDAISHHLR
jgi:hypothetical protein